MTYKVQVIITREDFPGMDLKLEVDLTAEELLKTPIFSAQAKILDTQLLGFSPEDFK